MKKIIDWIKSLFGSSPSADNSDGDSSKGFTLIELLIVIAVLGVLAAVVLVAIDPIEQLARGRDSGYKSSTGQLGRAVQAYYTAQQAYPTANNTWMTTLQNSGEIKTLPSGYNAPGCTGGGIQNNFCLKQNGIDFVVYTHLESKVERNKGTCANTAANTWYVYSSAAGKAGVVCQVAQPAAGFNGTFY